MSVLCFGELLVDLVSPEPDGSLAAASSFLKAPGGAPANVAVGLARLGIPSAFMGQVGDDPFGHWLREVLLLEGVDVRGLKLSALERTTLAFVATRRDGQKDICFYRNPGADASFAWNNEDSAPLAAVSAFHCGSVSLSAEPCRQSQFRAADAARSTGALISFDPNWRPSLWPDFDLAKSLIWEMIEKTDVVKVADEEWEFITGTNDFGRGAELIMQSGPRLVVMTRGAHGAAFACANCRGEVKGLQVDALDTLGAGDAFMAGLLSQLLAADNWRELLHSESLPQAIEFANGCGAMATIRRGAIPALPHKKELLAFLKARSSQVV
jgi:fructokinase